MYPPKLFVYEPKDQLVTAVQAADIVTHEGRNCHDFAVNNAHRSPDIADIASMIRELGCTPEDGEAYLMYECLLEALSAAEQRRYGVAAILASTRNGANQILYKAMNHRVPGDPSEFTGHAEMRLIDMATPYLQQVDQSHEGDIAGMTLSPCPGCFGHMIDAHFQTALVGSIDPQVGAAFLRGRDLQIAAGMPRKQVLEARNLIYRFPKISDEQLRSRILTLCWEVFHGTRLNVHRAAHGGALREEPSVFLNE